MVNTLEFTRIDGMMNIAAFFNTHFSMIALVGPWIYVGLTQEINFGDVQVCTLYDGDSIGLFDTICSTDIQTVEEWVTWPQYMSVVAFVCALNAFVITNWALANDFAERVLPVLSLGSFIGSLVAWAMWISSSSVDLPSEDYKVYYLGIGLYFTIMASILSFFMFLASVYRLNSA